MTRRVLTVMTAHICFLVGAGGCSGAVSETEQSSASGGMGQQPSVTPMAEESAGGMPPAVPVEMQEPVGESPSEPPSGSPAPKPPEPDVEEAEEQPSGPAFPALDPDAPPAQNFDLSSWYLSLPRAQGGEVMNVYEKELNDGFEDSDFFYTGEDGGMVFIATTEGPKTSDDTSYTRSELREMLRGGNTRIKTTGVNANNWVLSSAPNADRRNAGGVDGVLKATLAVNHVTTSGAADKRGRVIVGQIHANDDEPLRIYYHKHPNNERGSIYFAHEPLTGQERWIPVVGNDKDDDADPKDGIALDEVFSYQVVVSGNSLAVTIERDGHDPVTEEVGMDNSGFDRGGQYLYFKAGVYNQNDTGDGDDYVQATFYALEASHD